LSNSQFDSTFQH